MKKIKILALILSTTIATTSLSGCFKKDEVAPVNTEVTLSQTNNTNTINNDTDNTSNNTPIVVTEQGKYVGQDISLDTRIFTYNGFSVATKNKYDGDDILITESAEIDDLKSKLVSSIVDRISNLESSLSDEINDNMMLQFISQSMMIRIYFYAQMLDDVDESFFENMTEFIDKVLVVEENTHTINNQTVKQTSIYLNLEDLEDDEYNLGQTIDIFTLPYKDDDKFYDVFFVKNEDDNDVLIDIENMLDTFIYDTDLVELNNDGKSKFKFVSFTAYTDQKYVPNQVLIPYLKSFGTDITSNHLSLNFTDEALQESTYFSSDFTYYSSLGEDILEVGTNKFGINRVEVDVKLDNGEIVKDSLITQIVHTADEIDGFYTTIKFRSYNIEIDNYTFNKYDFDMLNTVFIDIMNTYEISLSEDALWYMDMSNEMDKNFKEQEDTAYNNKLERSIEVVTDAGFTTRYDPDKSYPQFNNDDQAEFIIPDNNSVAKNFIRFKVLDKNETMDHTTFLIDEKFGTDKSNEYIRQMDFELTTKIHDLGGKEITQEYYSVSKDVMNEYYTIKYENQVRRPASSGWVVVIYTYEINDKKYVMFSTSSDGFIYSGTHDEIEFMMRNLAFE